MKKLVVNNINNISGKVGELLNLIQLTPNWQNYVDIKTIKLIEDLQMYGNMQDVCKKNNIKYITLRERFLTASKRIRQKQTKFNRHGRSDKAQELINLIKKHENWEDILTDKEISYVKTYLKYKNFYLAGKELNVSPSNVAGRLYGTNQRNGVIWKIQNINILLKN